MEEKKTQRLVALSPVFVVLLVSSLIIFTELYRHDGDPLALARIGTYFSQGDPSGSLGYDGQFAYFIALNPKPQAVAEKLDAPAYRFQRILMPLLARFLAFGKPELIPWSLLLIGFVSIVAGTWAVSELFKAFGINRWFALVYGLWVGLVLSLITDLSEPLAYGLVACALLTNEKNHKQLSWILLGLALFTKEVTALFIVAWLISDLAQGRWMDAAGLAAVTIVPFALYQGWLWYVFGEPGISSGGAMATSFELIPYMGLFRVGEYNLAYLAAMLLVFGPAIILPSIWGVYQSVRGWSQGNRDVYTSALFLNALVIAFTPFSTFRETGGILRFACGLVLTVLLFAGHYRMEKVLNYSVLWIVLNVFLLK